MIYIVDDDEFVRRGFALLCRSADLDFMSFEKAEDFISMIELGENDILVLDMNMPGMHGCDVLDFLVKNEIFLPVIIITGYDDAANRDCAKKYGAVAYLHKPVDGQALIDLIRYSVNPV